ncbi:uncharacterized protein [Dermacentor albipictus]|uniref:uncharacterized protein isoform X2 n=1 Tax=Dermacentor albipictus TaxID=60249 RepID=UPI0038FD39CD
MASNARGRKGPVNSRTSTRKKSPAAKAKQSPASAAAPMAEAAPTAVHGSSVSDAATASRCTPSPAPEPNADTLLQMASSMATTPVTCVTQVVGSPVSPAADEGRPAPSYGKSTASRNSLAKSRSTGSTSATTPKQRAEEEADTFKKLNEFVARTINTLTLLLDGERTPSAWVPPTNATDASGTPGQHMWKLGRCPSSDAPAHVTSLYPVLPALEIAHDAYRRFRNVAEDVPLRGLEAYSAEQVFFLTACHVTCWTNSAGHRMSPECTDAMSNFAPFADAFDCPAGSPMNPHDRCRFF